MDGISDCMLKIIEDKKRFYIVYYPTIQNKKYVCNGINTVAAKTGLKLKDYIGIHKKHHAILDGNRFVFENMEDAKNCYFDIALERLEDVEPVAMNFWDIDEIDSSIFKITRFFDYINSTNDITKMARLAKLKKIDVINIFTNNDAKMVAPDVYVFVSRENCQKCINEMDDLMLSKAMIRKLTK